MLKHFFISRMILTGLIIVMIGSTSVNAQIQPPQIFGSAIELDGTGSYLTCSASICGRNFSITSDVTIESWISIEGFSQNHDFAGIISRPGSYSLTLRNSSSGSIYRPYIQLDYFYGGSNRQLQVPAYLSQNTWYHLSVVFRKLSDTSMNIKIFINGIQFASQDVTGGTGLLDNVYGNQPIFIGKSGNTSTRFFPGRIDEVRISDIARYNAHFTKPGTPLISDINTKALFHFNENSGVLAVDASSMHNDLAVSSALWAETADIWNFIPADCTQTGGNTVVIGPDSDTLLSYVTGKLLTSGQTLLLCDGIYKGAVAFNGKRFVDMETGAGNTVTVKAIHDGKVILDGTDIRSGTRDLKSGMIQIFSSSGITVEGIHAKNCYNPEAAQCSPVEIYYDSSYITLKRVTGKQDDPTAVSALFNITGIESIDPTGTLIVSAYAHHLTIEDCATYGFGRLGIMITRSTHHVVLRRFFNLAKGFQGANTWCQNIEMYGGHDNIIENTVAFNQMTDPLSCRDTTDPTHIQPYPFHGYIIPGSNQRFLGSVLKEGLGNAFYMASCNNCVFQDLVSIRGTNAAADEFGIFAERGRFNSPLQNNLINRATIISGPQKSHGVYLAGNAVSGDGITVNNSFFSASAPGSIGLFKSDYSTAEFKHAHNRFSLNLPIPYYNVSAGTNESHVDPLWNTAVYGDGAYLMATKTNLAGKGENGQSIGADVIYRYENGIITDKPLWPWPMEDRIMAETGVSVTWANKGGLWKTLEGVYDSLTPTISPAIPGDADGNGHVNGFDYVIWLNHYGSAVSGAANGDFNGDSRVDGLDYVVWLSNYGK